MDLVGQSIEVIQTYQDGGGAYLASPTFEHYQYCWFRDGSFIAAAMDLHARHESAGRFHQWAAAVLSSRESIIMEACQRAEAGEPLHGIGVLHARYSVQGNEVAGDTWGEFQLDGLGTWLWALELHFRLTGGEPTERQQRAAGLVAHYLACLWQTPCYDCWEEFPGKIHTYTLAAIWGGLKAYSRMGGPGRQDLLREIRAYLLEHTVSDGALKKFVGSEQVDASLIGAAVPYGLLNLEDRILHTTIERIEADLLVRGGLHRYPGDTYFGGGQWPLLSGWLGWYYMECGKIDRARQLREWIEDQADERGWLPEQVDDHLLAPEYLEPWRKRWGERASPLLWSHAMYLILDAALSHDWRMSR